MQIAQNLSSLGAETLPFSGLQVCAAALRYAVKRERMRESKKWFFALYANYDLCIIISESGRPEISLSYAAISASGNLRRFFASTGDYFAWAQRMLSLSRVNHKARAVIIMRYSRAFRPIEALPAAGMAISFDSAASATLMTDDDYYDISEFEPLSLGEFSHYGETVVVKLAPVEKPVVSKPKRQSTGCRYRQPVSDDQSSRNECFIAMMHSHSAIYSAFYHVNKRGLAVVPRNLLDILAVRTTKSSILLNQEQKTLLWINDRKYSERQILVNAILEEPGLNSAWLQRLMNMKTLK